MDRMAIVRTLAVAVAVGLLVALIAALHQRPESSFEPAAAPFSQSGDLSAELRRCGTLAPQDAEDPYCRAVWEENRRRFFGEPAQPVTTPTEPDAPTPEGGAP